MFIVFYRTVFSGREEMTEHSIEDYLYLQYLDSPQQWRTTH
jgi:hypothetical protein